MLLAVTVAALCAGHMPTADRGTASAPAELGDVTENSWAVCSSMLPGDVFYYSMEAPTLRGREQDRLWFGMYTPGCALNATCVEHDFDYSVAIWGMPHNTTCEPWGDGWGGVADVAPPGALPSRVASPGTVFVAGAEHIVLRAPAAAAGAAKFEPFTPTAFTPRGSCVADFPRAGTYHMAVWGSDAQVAERNWCVGVGLAERDVYSPRTLLLFGFIAWRVHRWNRWLVWELLWPYAAMLAAVAAYRRLCRRDPGGDLQLAAAGLLLGGAVGSMVILTWALRIAGVQGASWLIPLAVRVVLPAAVASRAMMFDRSKTPLEPLILGVVAAALGAGFLLAPLLLVLTAISAADSGNGNGNGSGSGNRNRNGNGNGNGSRNRNRNGNRAQRP